MSTQKILRTLINIFFFVLVLILTYIRIKDPDRIIYFDFTIKSLNVSFGGSLGGILVVELVCWLICHFFIDLMFEKHKKEGGENLLDDDYNNL